MLAGVISVVKPLRFLRIRTRGRGLLVAGLGLLGYAAGFCLPVAETQVENPRTRLDEFVPVYQSHEFHAITIGASKDRVWSAIWKVTPDEIRLYRTLTWMRRFGRPSRAGVLNAPGRRPILETFLATGFQSLAEEPGRELVFGFAGGAHQWAKSPAEFKALRQVPGVKIAMNFRVVDLDAGHSTLTTETRIYATGWLARQAWGAYWRMIFPGSSLIRYGWLRAIKFRAEAADSGLSAAGESAASR